MLKQLSTLVCAAMLASSCGTTPTTPTTPEVAFPVSLAMQVGQTQSAGALNVTFVGVNSDSRCPAAALCITSGDAYLQFALSTTDQSSAQQLQVYDPKTKSTRYAGFTVEVENLAPYPITWNSIKPEDYRVSVKVDR